MTNVAGERSAYRPLPHPGRPNRWTGDTVLAALRAWTAETGGPPRRHDWTGERPSRAGSAQRKWMREHPRWPSSSRVAAHFGTWSAALSAAALPARVLTFPTTVPERVLAARALAAEGCTAAEIAARLGVSRASAYNYLQARDCPGCGQPVTAPSASRCRDCTRHEPTVPRSWTREEASAAIQAWSREYGAAPSYHEWTPNPASPGRWEADSPRWPSAAVVCRLFGDWSTALREADVDTRPQPRRWDDEGVRAALAAFWVRTGRPPERADVMAPGWAGPSLTTLRRRYGGLAEAWSRFGQPPRSAASRPHMITSSEWSVR